MHMSPEQQLQDDDNDDFTFPTPHQLPLFATSRHHPCSSPSSSPAPVWLLSSPIRRSFSAADCAGSPWRNARAVLRRYGTDRGGACSPALSDYAGAAAGLSYGEDEDEEEEVEERMDSLWEDLNDDDAAAAAGNKKGDMFLASLDVSRRRSVGGADLAEKRKKPPAASNEREGGVAAALEASRSSRRRAPGLVAMMRSLKKMLVAHKGKSKVHKSDEQSNASASASSCGNSAMK